MLNAIRKNTKAIIWSVVIVFILWGGFSIGVQFQKEGRVAGSVFGKEVSYQEYDTFYRSNQMFSLGGKPSEDPEVLRKQTWQSIIFSREAKKRKIDVPDSDVRQEVLRLLSAQKIENPTPQVYRAWLRGNFRTTPPEFEAQVRELLRIQKLVNMINQAPIDTPSEEDAKKNFQYEQNEISGEIVKFPNQDEAKKFRDKVKTEEDWKREAKEVKQTGSISIDAWIHLWNISEADAFNLLKMNPKDVSQPVASANDYIVVKLVDKKIADDSKFEKELKEKYLKDLTEKKRYERFLNWSVEVNEKAKLKDFMPKSESSPASPS